MEEKTMQELEERRSAILTEVEQEGADLNALEEEARSINAEIERRKTLEAAKAEIREVVAEGAGEPIEKVEETRNMTNAEIRNTAEYIKAFGEYLRSGDDRECRALLTENVSGTVPVPEFVDNIVHTAWDRDQILSRVKRTYFRGNLKVAFERSADPAYVHTEGTTAHTEEALTLGTVTMIARNIKKWIRLSDEVVATGEDFVRYIYDEITYQIIHELSKLCVGDISGASTTHSSSAVGVPQVTAAPGATAIATAFSNLSDEATNPVVIINKATYADFYAAYAAGNFAVEPFMNLPVLYSSALPAYSTATGGTDVYAIVGDLSGVQVNYPEGDDVVIKWDDMTEAEKDLVKVVGRQYAAHAVVAPGKFAKIVKPAAATT